VRPDFPLSTLAKGKLHANSAELQMVGSMSLNSNKMEREKDAGGEAACGNAQRAYVANRNAQE